MVLVSCSVILLYLHRDKTPIESGGRYVAYYRPTLEGMTAALYYHSYGMVVYQELIKNQGEGKSV